MYVRVKMTVLPKVMKFIPCKLKRFINVELTLTCTYGQTIFHVLLYFTAPITNVEAIEGQQTHLYCPMATPNGDRINMVLWFKDDVGVPIYR